MYYNALKLMSYNAIFNFVDGARNIGKSTGFKIRSIRRAYKKGKATYWLRRYDDEVKQTCDKFLNAKLLKLLNMTVYHKKDNPDGTIKREGRKIYVKNRAGKWVIAVQFICLSDAAKYRSADDDAFDSLVFDEYTTTAARYAYYRGDEVQDFIDLYISLKRENKLICYFLGNKETTLNPYKRFFNMHPLPLTWQGIKRYRRGSIIVQQVNDVLNADIAYNEKLREALTGTRYLSYLLEGSTKNARQATYTEINYTTARLYGQFNKGGQAVSIYIQNGKMIVTDKINTAYNVFTDLNEQIYTKQKSLVNKHRAELYALENAVIDNRIAYTSASAYELAQPLLRWLCNIK